MERGQVWQSLAVAQGVGIVAGSGDTDAYVEFFGQVYENDARIQQSAAKCKRKGK